MPCPDPCTNPCSCGQLFPFDKHELNLTFVLSGSTSSTSSVLLGCATVADSLDTSELLPRDNSWLFESISYAELDRGCQIRVKIRRNSLVFFIKNVLILIIIITGGEASAIVERPSKASVAASAPPNTSVAWPRPV